MLESRSIPSSAPGYEVYPILPFVSDYMEPGLGPKATGPIGLGWKTLQLCAKVNLFSLWLSGMYYRMREK